MTQQNAKPGRKNERHRTKPEGSHASNHMTIRWDSTERAKVQRAAVLTGLTISDFVREAALDRAASVLGVEQHVDDEPSTRAPLLVVLPERLQALKYEEREPNHIEQMEPTG